SLKPPERHRGRASDPNSRKFPCPPAERLRFSISMWGSTSADATRRHPARNYDRFQGLNERTCQSPCCCLQASPCTQACELPETKLARKSRHVCPSCI